MNTCGNYQVEEMTDDGSIVLAKFAFRDDAEYYLYWIYAHGGNVMLRDLVRGECVFPESFHLCSLCNEGFTRGKYCFDCRGVI